MKETELHDELLLRPDEDLPDKWWEKEYWKQVENADAYYVSTLGRVYSTKHNKLLTIICGNSGCATVDIVDNVKKKHKHSVRRLVFETFFFKVPSKYSIIPVNNDKMDCSLDNLGVVNHYDCMFGHTSL